MNTTTGSNSSSGIIINSSCNNKILYKCIVCTKKFNSDSVTNKNNRNTTTTGNTSENWKIFCKYVYGINVDCYNNNNQIPPFCVNCVTFLDKLSNLHQQLELIQSNIVDIVSNINQTIVHSHTFLTFDSSNNNSMASDNNSANYVCPEFLLQERLIQTSHDQASTVNVRVILDERMAAERRNNSSSSSKVSKNQRSSIIPCASNLIPQALPISLWPPNTSTTTITANTLDNNSISILLPTTVPQQSLQQGQFDWNWKPVQSVLSPSTSISSSTASTNNNNIVDECQEFNAEYAAQTIFGLHPNVKSECSSKDDTSSKVSSAYSGTESKITTSSSSSRRRSTGDKRTTAQHSSSSSSSNSEANGGTISIHAGKWPFKTLDDGQYQCITCNSVKKTRQLLMTHLTYHRLIDMKKWSCKICGKCFCRQREVIRHEKTHNGSCATSSPLPLSKITETGNQSEFLYEGTWPFEKLEDNSFRCNTCGCRKEKKAGILSHLRWVHHLKQSRPQQTP